MKNGTTWTESFTMECSEELVAQRYRARIPDGFLVLMSINELSYMSFCSSTSHYVISDSLITFPHPFKNCLIVLQTGILCSMKKVRCRKRHSTIDDETRCQIDEDACGKSQAWDGASRSSLS